MASKITESEDVNNEQRHYQDAMQAQLGERVTNLGRRQSDLENEMRSGFRQIEQSFTSFTNETRLALNTLSSSLAERNKPNFQALGVMLTAMVVLGGLLYWPIRETTTDLKQTLRDYVATSVSRQEMDWRSTRGAEDRDRTDESIKDLRLASVTRAEWGERNHARDNEIAEINRRLDEIRQEVGAVYGTRDVIIDLKKEVDTLRQRLSSYRAMSSPPSP